MVIKVQDLTITKEVQTPFQTPKVEENKEKGKETFNPGKLGEADFLKKLEGKNNIQPFTIKKKEKTKFDPESIVPGSENTVPDPESIVPGSENTVQIKAEGDKKDSKDSNTGNSNTGNSKDSNTGNSKDSNTGSSKEKKSYPERYTTMPGLSDRPGRGW